MGVYGFLGDNVYYRLYLYHTQAHDGRISLRMAPALTQFFRSSIPRKSVNEMLCSLSKLSIIFSANFWQSVWTIWWKTSTRLVGGFCRSIIYLPMLVLPKIGREPFYEVHRSKCFQGGSYNQHIVSFLFVEGLYLGNLFSSRMRFPI